MCMGVFLYVHSVVSSRGPVAVGLVYGEGGLKVRGERGGAWSTLGPPVSNTIQRLN